MSNLLKSRNIKCDNGDKKVIDYNELITEKIAMIQRKIETEQREEALNGGFVEGIDARSVERLLNEDSNVIRETQAASEKADEIIALANSDAQAIIEQAKQECEAIKQAAHESGRKEGYQEGKVQAVKELEVEKNRLEEERSCLKQEYDRKVKEIEPELVDTILKVFEKVTHVLAEDKKDLVFRLVDDVISKTEFSSDILIRTSSGDYKFLIDNRELLRNSVHNKIQIEIAEDPTFARGQCMIESDSGIYDCSLDIQLESLINNIKILSCMTE